MDHHRSDDRHRRRRHRRPREEKKYDDDDENIEEEEERRRRRRRRRREEEEQEQEQEANDRRRKRRRRRKESKRSNSNRRHRDNVESASSASYSSSSSSSSSSDEEEVEENDRKRKRRSRDKDRKYSRKREDHNKKSKKQKKKKRTKSSKRDRQQQQPKDKSASTPSKPDKSKLYDMGPNLGRVPDTLIDPQHDYFTYHQPFWVYLYREEGVAFNDLTSEDAHKAFGRFAKEYNAGRLEHPYYSKSKSHSSSSDSFPKQVLDECKTTQHSWSFQTTATERKGLQVLQEGVRHQTEYSQQQQEDKPKQASASMSSIISPAQRLLEERLQERRANKRLKDHVKTVHEELSGGAKDLRERKLEQRRQQANRIHGAARQKEEALGGIELDDAALYGSSTQNHHNSNNSEEAAFQKALTKQRAHKAQRQEERTHRIEELQQKEKERQENMMKMLGLQGLMKSGQKIKIAPRNPAEPR